MKKNSQLHIFLETELRELLEKQAKEGSISISELCRRKLRENDRLNRIEFILNQIQNSILDNRGLYKSSNLKSLNKLDAH